jgi:hypothetical protein
VQEVGGGVVAGDVEPALGVHHGVHGIAHGQPAGLDLGTMDEHVGHGAIGVAHQGAAAGGHEFAGVAHLAARLAVKGRGGQHHVHGLAASAG